MGVERVMNQIITVTVFSLVCIVCVTGCNQSESENSANGDQSPAEIAQPEDREALDRYLASRSTLKDHGRPSQIDHKYARTLRSEVLEAVLSYMGKDKTAVEKGYGPIEIISARDVHGFILLDVRTRFDDGNWHLIYSPRRKMVVDTFGWYIQ